MPSIDLWHSALISAKLLEEYSWKCIVIRLQFWNESHSFYPKLLSWSLYHHTPNSRIIIWFTLFSSSFYFPEQDPSMRELWMWITGTSPSGSNMQKWKWSMSCLGSESYTCCIIRRLLYLMTDVFLFLLKCVL